MKVSKSDILLQSIKRLMRRDALEHAKRLLLKSHPSEVASVLRQFADDEAVALLKLIKGTEIEADAFVELEGKFVETYLEITKDKEHIVHVLQNLSEDEAANLLAEISDEDLAAELLSMIKGPMQQEVNELLQYEDDSCGRIMAVNVFSVNQNDTAAEAISKIQQADADEVENFFYLYITDDFENLVGVISLKQLLQVPSKRVLKEFMIRDVLTVSLYDSQEKAARYVEEYNFVSLPVVDREGKLAGVVMVDDVIDYIRDEQHEEVLQLAGVEPEAIEDFSFWRAFASKAVWYGLLFLGGLICSEIILRYFGHLPKEVVAFCFAPLVLRLGGSIATQSTTLVYEGVLSKDFEQTRARRALWGQNSITFLVSLVLATLVYAYGVLRFQGELEMSIGLSLGVFSVAVFSVLFGTFMPFVFDRLKLDSLKLSSRFVHFLMDAMSLLVYFQVAGLIHLPSSLS